MMFWVRGHTCLRDNDLHKMNGATYKFFSCPHHSPHITPVSNSAYFIPQRDAAVEEALSSAPVECSEDGREQVGSLQPPQEVQVLLYPLSHSHSVY